MSEVSKAVPVKRCVVYARVSTDERLGQSFINPALKYLPFGAAHRAYW